MTRAKGAPHSPHELTCGHCRSGPGEHCHPDCPNPFRREAGLERGDGNDPLRRFWVEQGAPLAANPKTGASHE